MDGGALALHEWPVAAPAHAPLPGRSRRAIGEADFEFMLDCVADALVVIDAHARVLHANRPARELLGRVRDAAQGCGALLFRDRATQRDFERALAWRGEEDRWRLAGDDGRPGDEPLPELAPRPFLVRDAAGRIVARATVEPLRRRRHDGAGASAHLVSLHRQPDPDAISAVALRALYGLTAGEARVAAATLAAHSVDELARHLGLSRNTVKSHLKRVFRKCEVQSCAQLAALVATGPRLR